MNVKYLAFIISGALLFVSCGGGMPDQTNVNTQSFSGYKLLSEQRGLSIEEQAGLLRMREEEKLARDVYTALGKKFPQPIFFNIAQSENTHMEQMRMLLERYQIEDPVKDKKEGEFESKEMQDLYKSLVERGTVSIQEAYKVGALVEEMDIVDIRKLMSGTQKQEIRTVYEALARGSHNHLRSFVRQLRVMRVEYAPQYVSKEELQEIIGGGNLKF